jgi:hypothetical protein
MEGAIIESKLHRLPKIIPEREALVSKFWRFFDQFIGDLVSVYRLLAVTKKASIRSPDCLAFYDTAETLHRCVMP